MITFGPSLTGLRDTQVAGSIIYTLVNIGQVFMDAGSGINLTYARTLKAMNISLEWVQPTDCSFHGIVLGSANHPLGKIELDVCFGDSGNFQRENWNSKSWIGPRNITQS
jgi:hypothetical protein